MCVYNWDPDHDFQGTFFGAMVCIFGFFKIIFFLKLLVVFPPMDNCSSKHCEFLAFQGE